MSPLRSATAVQNSAYSTGAAPTKADKPDVEAIVRNVRDRNYGFKSLIHEVIQSPVFQAK